MGSTLGSLIRIGSNYIMNEFLKRHFNYMFFSWSTHTSAWLAEEELYSWKLEQKVETEGTGRGSLGAETWAFSNWNTPWLLPGLRSKQAKSGTQSQSSTDWASGQTGCWFSLKQDLCPKSLPSPSLATCKCLFTTSMWTSAFSPKHGARSALPTCLDSCWVFWARIIKRHEGQMKSADDFEKELAKSSGLPGHVCDAQHLCIWIHGHCILKKPFAI